MTERWTEAQVLLLIPTWEEFSAAYAYDTLHNWNETGWWENYIWGLYGKNPYKTVVDITGPTYNCSCSVPKSPCKHVLSLLLCWSQSEIGRRAEVRVEKVAAPATFVRDWISANKPTAMDTLRAPAKGIPTPARRTVSAKTAQQQQERIATGLPQLGRWLTDQIRAGLVWSAQEKKTRAWMTERMVDIHALGVADMLRLLDDEMAGRDDWADVMLDRFVRLHLLVEAHQRIDELDEALAASARARIGGSHPSTVDPAGQQPAIRDSWLVVSEVGGRFSHRTTWLVGRRTATWATIAESDRGALPELGGAIEADLHFCPAAAPLCAVLGERRGDPEIDTTPIGEDIPTGLARYVAAVAADPWVEFWPLMLREVVPVHHDNRWYLRDPQGRALPMAESDHIWSVVGASGGYPVTVVGEWDGHTITPLTVYADEHWLAIFDDTDSIPVEVVSVGAELTSTFLVGTDRGARRMATPTTGSTHPESDTTASDLLDTEAKRLLNTAATRIAAARAETHIHLLDETCEKDDTTDPRPLLPPMALAVLDTMLRDSVRFTRWVKTAEPSEYRAPDWFCAELLRHARYSGNKARLELLRLAGSRGQWLARQNPKYAELVRRNILKKKGSQHHAKTQPLIWRFGDEQQRQDWFVEKRKEDPQAARELLREGWFKEAGWARVRFLAAFHFGLSPADKGFLEIATGDNREDLRTLAEDFLSRIAQNPTT